MGLKRRLLGRWNWKWLIRNDDGNECDEDSIRMHGKVTMKPLKYVQFKTEQNGPHSPGQMKAVSHRPACCYMAQLRERHPWASLGPEGVHRPTRLLVATGG